MMLSVGLQILPKTTTEELLASQQRFFTPSERAAIAQSQEKALLCVRIHSMRQAIKKALLEVCQGVEDKEISLAVEGTGFRAELGAVLSSQLESFGKVEIFLNDTVAEEAVASLCILDKEA